MEKNPAQVDFAINQELTQILYRNLSLGLFGCFCLASILVYQLLGHINEKQLVGWYILLMANLLNGYLVIIRYKTTKDDSSEHKHHYYDFVIGSSYTAFMFGMIGSFLMPADLSHQLLTILVVIAISGASVQNMHASYLASILWLSFCMVPVLMWELVQIYTGHNVYISIFIASLTFFVYLAVDVQSGYTMLLNNIKLKLDNIYFAKTLQEQKSMMENLSGLVARFQSCTQEREIYAIFSEYLPKLFKNTSMVLHTFNNNTNEFEAVVSTATADVSFRKIFKSTDCTAILTSINQNDNRGCNHFVNSFETLCIPLIAGNEFVGSVSFLSDQGKFTSYQKDIMQRLGADIALAISNVRLSGNLRNSSIQDALTGLYNRRYLNEILMKIISRSNRSKKEVSFILFDIDHFKVVNDTYGHAAGDNVLVKLSQSIKNYFRETDYSFRYGGEEFLIILEGVSADEAVKRIDEFRKTIKHHPVELENTHYQISISAGVSTYPTHGTHVDTLISLADKALYKAKKLGRDRVFVAKPLLVDIMIDES